MRSMDDQLVNSHDGDVELEHGKWQDGIGDNRE